MPGLRTTDASPSLNRPTDAGSPRQNRGADEVEPSKAGVESISLRLRARFGNDVDPATIEAEVEAELISYSTAPITQYIPILVERRVWDRLGTSPPAALAATDNIRVARRSHVP